MSLTKARYFLREQLVQPSYSLQLSSSCVSKDVFEAVQIQISSLFKVFISKQGEIATTIIDLNKMIIEVNKRVEQAVHAGNIAP